MGLDMYAYETCEDIPSVDFDYPASMDCVFYWRKHPDLHGWMEELYRKKGGRQPEFNLVPVRIEGADLDALEQAVIRNALPFTTGFFFGQSHREYKADDLEFIRKARTAISAGRKVFYTSWW